MCPESQWPVVLGLLSLSYGLLSVAVAYIYGLRIKSELLSAVACDFGLLGLPGECDGWALRDAV